jgi:1-acyl-sn-glycerol-3-phosphate acyltransferase
MGSGLPSSGLPRADVSPWQRAVRYAIVRTVIRTAAAFLFRMRLVGADRIPPGPALYCFNHLGWLDPIVIMATFPSTPRIYFYGPKESDLRHGIQKRIILWSGIAVPFRPSKDDLITSVRRAEAVFDSGAILAIAGEGQIHVHEGDLLPLHEGPAYLALRARVPIVPVAITGTSLVGFRRTITVRIGEPIATGPRPTHTAVADYTALTWHAIRGMIADDRDLPRPGPFGRWFSDVFNDWGPGGREAAAARVGPAPDEVPRPVTTIPSGAPLPGPSPLPDPVELGPATLPATPSG